MNFTSLASQQTLKKTADALKKRGFEEVVIVDDRSAALKAIQKMIPAGASVMNGSSVTLEEIGLVEQLNSGKHPWNNLHAAIYAQENAEQRAQLRKEAVNSDYYLGSVHGLAETGEFVVASNTGSQLPHIVFTSPNLIFVVGAQKVVPTLADALKRLEEYVVPLEDKHMQDLYNVHTHLSKLVIFKAENLAVSKRKLRMILVREKLGF